MQQVQIKCDFCGAPETVARHEVDQRDLAPWEDEPKTWWYACYSCHKLIMDDDLATLNGRVATHNPLFKDLDLIDAVNAAVGHNEPFLTLLTGVYEQFVIE